MSPLNAVRARKPRHARRSALRLECLESRLPLAGNVTAQLIGSTLLLTGDALDNQVIVASAPGGKMAVFGPAGNTINGSTSAFTTSRAVTNIVANLNGGSDQIGFGNNASALDSWLVQGGIVWPQTVPELQAAIDGVALGVTTFSLPGSLAVTTGAGNDAVGIVGNVGGSVAANLGSAIAGATDGNGFGIGELFNTKTVTSHVGGAVSVVGGAQIDYAAINGTNVGGGVSLALGNGENRGKVSGAGATIGSFAYTGGTAADDVIFNPSSQLTVKNGVSVFTGTQGVDEILLVAMTIGGSVVLNTGAGAGDDTVYVGRVTVRGQLSSTTGTGNDEVIVDFVTVGLSLAVNSGAGDDEIEVTNDTVGLNTVIDAGAGNDSVLLANMQIRSTLFASLGAGNDVLTVDNTTALAAFLYGGAGANTLNTNAATRTGIRTLRFYQFQTVNNT